MHYKRNMILCITMLCITATYAQLALQEHTLDNTSCIQLVYPSDIDGDGDIDFFATCFSQEDQYITWYENSDGQETFIIRDTISSENESSVRLYACDLDGDGDMDILASSQGFAPKIFWYENTDGLGNFGDRQLIGEHTNISWSLSAADMDGDGDLDVVAAISADHKVVWYENMDGLGDFGVEQIIATEVYFAWSMYVSDVDGDGDNDVTTISEGNEDSSGTIAWHENEDGLGNFGNPQIIATDLSQANKVYTADLDNDGDEDAISTAYSGGIAWYENEDGLGSFSAPNIISQEGGVAAVAFNDLDGDSYIDLLVTYRLSGNYKVVWYQHLDGEGTFGEQQLITNASIPQSAHAIDMDADTDIDILFTSGQSFENSATTIWYENLLLSSTKEYTLLDFDIYPTLATDYLSVASDTEILSIEIYTVLGTLALKALHPTTVDISKLGQGSYYCVVRNRENQLGIKQILKH